MPVAAVVWWLPSNATTTINSVGPGVRVPPWSDFEFICTNKKGSTEVLRAPRVGRHNSIRRESTREERAEVFAI